jgi:hypothetical protein
MKATEILAKLMEVLNMNDIDSNEIKDIEVKAEVTEIVEEIKEEIKDEVVLAEDTVESEVPVEVEEKPAYATLSDLTSLKNEILDMLAAYAEVSKEYNKEVPSELNSDKEEVKVELSEEKVTEITHSPESITEEIKIKKLSTRRPMNTQDRVFAKLFKK